jgi:DNA-directed RNA polymerase specialized sigma subunit
LLLWHNISMVKQSPTPEASPEVAVQLEAQLSAEGLNPDYGDRLGFPHKVHSALSNARDLLGEDCSPEDLAACVIVELREQGVTLKSIGFSKWADVAAFVAHGEEPEITTVSRAKALEGIRSAEEDPTTSVDSMLTLTSFVISNLVDSLEEIERQILRDRFGLDRGEPRTLEEVAKIHGLSRDNVRLIEARAMSKLRHPGFSEEV